ncbi:membrane progestin receptor alpha [Lonchura striata]
METAGAESLSSQKNPAAALAAAGQRNRCGGNAGRRRQLVGRRRVLFFLVAAFFFSHPYPEKCHFFGQSHQIFHVFLVLCTLAQIEAMVLDYESWREIYSSLQRDLAHDFSALFLATVTCSVLTAAYMAWRVKNKLGLKEE